jgi:hypothetical protein
MPRWSRSDRNEGDRRRRRFHFRTVWKWLKDNETQLKIIFAIVAASYALSEYKAKDYLDRVKNSADVLEKFYGGDGYKAVTALDDYWLSLSPQREQLESNKITATQYRELVTDGVRSSHRPDMLRAIRSLKTVSMCAIQGRCDAASLCTQLAQTMEDLRCNFREYISELSTQNGACIVDEIDYLLDVECKEWLASYLGVSSYRSIKDDFCLFDRGTNSSKLPMCMESIIFKKKVGFFSRYLD